MTVVNRNIPAAPIRTQLPSATPSKPLADFKINGRVGNNGFDGSVNLGDGNPQGEGFSGLYRLGGTSGGRSVRLVAKLMPDGTHQLGDGMEGGFRPLESDEIQGLRESAIRGTFGFSQDWMGMELPQPHKMEDGIEKRVPKKEFLAAVLGDSSGGPLSDFKQDYDPQSGAPKMVISCYNGGATDPDVDAFSARYVVIGTSNGQPMQLAFYVLPDGTRTVRRAYANNATEALTPREAVGLRYAMFDGSFNLDKLKGLPVQSFLLGNGTREFSKPLDDIISAAVRAE